jgi:hypothetical protein
MNRNLVGSIYGRSSVKFAHFVPIRGFRGEDFLEIDQSETRIPVVAMFVNGSGRYALFIEDRP